MIKRVSRYLKCSLSVALKHGVLWIRNRPRLKTKILTIVRRHPFLEAHLRRIAAAQGLIATAGTGHNKSLSLIGVRNEAPVELPARAKDFYVRLRLDAERCWPRERS